MPWITHVDWAQMQDPICAIQCDVIGLLDQNGHRRAPYNAYSIYANMPVDRRQLTIGGSVDGLASADQHKASVALWNLSGSDQAVNVALKNISFATGNFRVYRIDATHASFVDNPNSETLTPTEQYPNVQTGGLTWSGTIPSNSMVYLEVEDGSGATQLNPVTVGKVIRVQNYDPDRTKASYADFDPKTWIGHLGMAGNQWADQEVGVTAEQLPASLDITSQIDGALVKNDANSCACVRVDYQVNGAYTKGVLFHGSYNGSVDLYDPARSAPMPWGTQRQPDQVVSVPNIASFPISLSQYAPSGWSGRVQLTSILQNAGNNARWKVTIRPTLPVSPKAHWTFDDGSGTTASDSSGNNNTGTLHSGATWTSSGRVGSHAINFDGSNNAVVDAPYPVIDTSQSYAVAAWVKLYLIEKSGGLCRRERDGGVSLSRALGDEGGQGGHAIGTGETVVQIVGDVDAELGRCLGDRAEDVPGGDARLGARAEAHVALAHALARPQLSRVVVQGDLRMIQDAQQGCFLGGGRGDTLVEVPVAGAEFVFGLFWVLVSV